MRIQSESTVQTVSNAIALAAGIVKEVMGNEVASTLEGSELSQGALSELIATEIGKAFIARNVTAGVK